MTDSMAGMRRPVAVIIGIPWSEALTAGALIGKKVVLNEFLAYLARSGYAVPAELLDRDWSQPYRLDPALVAVFAEVYADPSRHWGVYETCEELVDVEDN